MDEITQPQEFDDCFDSCYLGDAAKEHMRVRAPLSSDELTRIEAACQTPEELALSLLDLLLDREALDDLSEHSQADLDRLIIHAIHLHLIYVFNISDDNWSEIQTELLSKCPSTNHTRTCELTDDTNSFIGQEFSNEYCPASESSDKAFQMDVTDLDLVD